MSLVASFVDFSNVFDKAHDKARTEESRWGVCPAQFSKPSGFSAESNQKLAVPVVGLAGGVSTNFTNLHEWEGDMKAKLLKAEILKWG